MTDTLHQTRDVTTYHQRCVRVKRNGVQCGLPAMRGTTVCQMHGGRAPQVRAAAQRRLALAEGLKGVAQLVADNGLPEPTELHPAEHLLRGLALSAMLVEALANTVAAHDAKPGDSLSEAWERERERHARLAKATLDAGIDERLARVAEQQVTVLSGILEAVIQELGHDPADPAVRQIIHAKILEVGSALDSDTAA